MLKQQETAWHSIPADAVIREFVTTSEGLSSAEAAERLSAFGPNRLPEVRGRSVIMRFLTQLDNVLIYVLLGAAAVTASLGHWVDAGVILAVVIVNAVIGFIQEGKAESALAAIRHMLSLSATALRDGRRTKVDSAKLVPGDIVLLEAGDKVPADLRVLEAQGLSAQEAILTGESVPVEKSAEPVLAKTILGDRQSMLWSGTLVTRGTARGIVIATGVRTEIGRIGGLLAKVEPLSTPLVTQMAAFTRWLSFLILAASSLLLVYGYLLSHLEFSELFMAVVGLAVAAIPEGLPAVMTITLAIGVQAMARRHAIIRRLPAIEAIGSISVICTDKTGTLTRNEMVVARAETPSGSFHISGEGYAPEGTITPAGDLSRLALAAALCNDAALHRKGHHWMVEGDPMEGALLAFAAKLGADVTAQRLGVMPFDSRHRFMAVLTDSAAGRLIQVKGAPERVLRMCIGVDYRHWHDKADAMARQGLRVLALAERISPAPQINRSALEEGLVFLGLLGLMDQPRPEAIKAVAECRSAGIRVKMITGDHAGTAAAIAAQIGLENPHQVLTGAAIDQMDNAQLGREALLVDVFARTDPEHKLRLVTALQASGLSVAMTGDGVNDAPALKRADAGIAMGMKGSEAAKEAADLVLADDNFVSIVAAIREGRTVWDNLRKVISFEIPTSVGEAMIIVIAILVGLSLPVTAIQILWINLITGVTLGLALAFEPTEAGTMARRPRSKDTRILNGELVRHIALVATLFVVAVFGVFTYAIEQGYSLALAQTMAMNTLVVLEIFHLLFIRNVNTAFLTWDTLKGTGIVWAVVIIIAAAQFAVTYLPLFQVLLGTEAVLLADGLLIAAVGMIFFLVIEAEKQIRVHLQKGKHRH